MQGKLPFIGGVLMLGILGWMLLEPFWTHWQTSLSISAGLKGASAIGDLSERLSALWAAESTILFQRWEPLVVVFCLLVLRAPLGDPSVLENAAFMIGLVCCLAAGGAFWFVASRTGTAPGIEELRTLTAVNSVGIIGLAAGYVLVFLWSLLALAVVWTRRKASRPSVRS